MVDVYYRMSSLIDFHCSMQTNCLGFAERDLFDSMPGLVIRKLLLPVVMTPVVTVVTM